MSLVSLSRDLADTAGVDRQAVMKVLDSLFSPRTGVIARELASGRDLSIERFGVFRLDKRRSTRIDGSRRTTRKVTFTANGELVLAVRQRVESKNTQPGVAPSSESNGAGPPPTPAHTPASSGSVPSANARSGQGAVPHPEGNSPAPATAATPCAQQPVRPSASATRNQTGSKNNEAEWTICKLCGREVKKKNLTRHQERCSRRPQQNRHLNDQKQRKGAKGEKQPLKIRMGSPPPMAKPEDTMKKWKKKGAPPPAPFRKPPNRDASAAPRSGVDRCRWCGSPAIPGTDHCNACYQD